MTPMVVQLKSGDVGHVLVNEPTVKMHGIEKVVVHLMKKGKGDSMVPKVKNGSPLKVLVGQGNFEIIKGAEVIRAPRAKGVRGESNRDNTKFVFDGQVLAKSRVCLALIRKFVSEKNPTMAQLKAAFPEESIKPYGKMFISFDEAASLDESKRKRFFVKEEDKLQLTDATVVLTNQVDLALAQRFISVASNHGYVATSSI